MQLGLYKGRAGPLPYKFRGFQSYNTGCLSAFSIAHASLDFPAGGGAALGMGSLLTEESDGEHPGGACLEGHGHQNG